jgi:hypothetical protein
MLCDGGDCVQDLVALRGQGTLLGPVVSETTAHRVMKSIDAELLDRLGGARAGRAPRRGAPAPGPSGSCSTSMPRS